MCLFLFKCFLNKCGCYRLFTLLCFASTVLCITPGTDRPDITMLYKKDTKICVAGSNTQGFGLAFMSKNISDDVYEDNFEYRDGYGNLINTTGDCDFEEREGDTCSEEWVRNGSPLKIQLSNKDPIAPVTDERWNNFAAHRTDEQNDRILYSIKNNFFISISIRSTKSAQILLCSALAEPAEPNLDSCYWIEIDAMGSHETTVITKKRNDELSLGVSKIATRPGKLLNESKWTHFMLSRERNNEINLWLWDIQAGEKNLLKYTDKNPFPISFMIFRSPDSIADWKTHDYQYLMTTKFPIRPLKFRSLLNFASSSVCVSLYVTMCKACKIEIKLQDESDFALGSSIIKANPNEKFMTWRNIKIQSNINASLSSNRSYNLVVVLTKETNYSNPYWAIDDVRKCARNEIRVARITTTKEIQCQSLKYPYWTFNTNKQINSSEPPICRDGRYIGLYCNIPCSVIPDGCTDQKICLPIQKESDKGACTCAAGNLWTKYGCAKKCINYYGYNCKNECGICRNSTCNRVTGECEHGCKYDELLLPFCKNSLPRLVSPPIVTNISDTRVAVIFNDVRINGSINMVHSILLQCKKQNHEWYNCSDTILYTKLKNQINVITSLEKETLYFIRGVVYTNKGNAYTNDDLQMSNFTTTCKTNRIVQIDTNAWNATIKFENSNVSCNLRNYIVQLKLNKYNILQKYASQNMILSNLQPYTDYDIVVTKRRDTKYNDTRKFKTKAAEPPAVRNFTAYSRNTTSVSVRWLDPYPPQGQLESYLIQYKTLTSKFDYAVTTANLKSCDLWNENYKCFLLSCIYPNFTYKITIKAKNKDVTSYGPETEISARTEEDKSSAPLNLTQEWINNEMNLYWNHPNIMNGIIQKFRIVVELKSTYFINQISNKSNIIYEYKINKEMKNYHYKVPTSFLFSSTYMVSVCAVNSFNGENATLITDSPPPRPELDGDLTVESEKITDTCVILVIPAIKKNTKSENSFLYVLVSNPENGMSNNEKGLKQRIFQHAGSKSSAIVIERKLNDKEITLLVGDDSEAYSANLQEFLHNKHLKPGTDYNITIVLMNQYKNNIRLNNYTVHIKTTTNNVLSSSSELYYTLFVLLLLPLGGYFIYRFRKKKLVSPTYIEPNERFELIANTANGGRDNPDSSNYDYIEPNVPAWHILKANGTNVQSNNLVTPTYDYIEPISQRKTTNSYLEVIADDTNIESSTYISSDEHTYDSVDHIETRRTHQNVPQNDHIYVNSPMYVNS